MLPEKPDPVLPGDNDDDLPANITRKQWRELTTRVGRLERRPAPPFGPGGPGVRPPEYRDPEHDQED